MFPAKLFAMKSYILLFEILVLACNLHAQKQDYIWLAGDDSFSTNPNFGGITINFNNDTLQVYKEDRYMNFSNGNEAAISSYSGSLLFYTNGCSLANYQNEMLENGDSINTGSIFNSYCTESNSDGYPSGDQSSIIIPLPNSDSIYFLFHKRVILITNPLNVLTLELLYSIVDMSANNGAGKVISKNQVFHQDTFAYGDMTAVRHANSEDWWLVSPGDRNNKYFVFKFDADGITLVHELALGDPTPSSGEGGGQVLFSPDGSKYIRFNPHNKIRMFDFDRTTGLLSNYQNIDVDFGSESPFDGGLLISPSGQYLYISVKRHLYQMDLFSADVEASQTLVGEFDGYADPLAANFGRGLMGPDCKLYIYPGNDNRVIHIVHNPNEPGLDCNFEQHALNTLTHHGSTFPNFPNFRLGALGEPVSPCAGYTVNSTEAPVFNSGLPLVSVFPNPASEYVRVLPNRPLSEGAVWSLYDGMGQRVRTAITGVVNEAVEVSLLGLPSGMYVWELRAGHGAHLGSGKLVVR